MTIIIFGSSSNLSFPQQTIAILPTEWPLIWLFWKPKSPKSNASMFIWHTFSNWSSQTKIFLLYIILKNMIREQCLAMVVHYQKSEVKISALISLWTWWIVWIKEYQISHPQNLQNLNHQPSSRANPYPLLQRVYASGVWLHPRWESGKTIKLCNYKHIKYWIQSLWFYQ